MRFSMSMKVGDSIMGKVDPIDHYMLGYISIMHIYKWYMLVNIYKYKFCMLISIYKYKNDISYVLV